MFKNQEATHTIYSQVLSLFYINTNFLCHTVSPDFPQYTQQAPCGPVAVPFPVCLHFSLLVGVMGMLISEKMCKIPSLFHKIIAILTPLLYI